MSANYQYSRRRLFFILTVLCALLAIAAAAGPDSLICVSIIGVSVYATRKRVELCHLLGGAIGIPSAYWIGIAGWQRYMKSQGFDPLAYEVEAVGLFESTLVLLLGLMLGTGTGWVHRALIEKSKREVE